MTAEDVFARWMNPILLKGAVKNHQRGFIRFVPDETGNVKPLQVSYRRPGHAASLKIEHFCAPCNNGFMSELENKNKAVLTALINGQGCLLMPYMLRNLVGWIAKTTSALEYYEPGKRAIPQSDRDWIRTNRMPPAKGWHIFIAPYEGPRWITRVFHHSSHLPAKDPKDRIPGDNSINIQSTMFVIGHVAFYVVSMTAVGHDFSLRNERLADWRRIWPSAERVEPWPRARVLNKADLIQMIDSFNKAMGISPLRFLD